MFNVIAVGGCSRLHQATIIHLLFNYSNGTGSDSERFHPTSKIAGPELFLMIFKYLTIDHIRISVI